MVTRTATLGGRYGAKLQAALYYARKQRLARLLGSSSDETSGFVQVVYQHGASNEHGGARDDPTATRTSEDADPKVYFVNSNDINEDGSLVLQQPAFDEPFPRIGASVEVAVPIGINAAKAIYSSLPGDVVVLLVPLGFGGQGIFADGDVPGFGPMHPDGPGPAFTVGAGSIAASVSGALYLYATGSELRTKLAALITSEFPDRTRLPDISIGKVANENDVDGSLTELIDESMSYVEGFRTAMSDASMPFLLSSTPPPFSFSSAVSSRKYSAAMAALAEKLPYAAYSEGPGEPEFQHSTEPIHFGNPGSRAQGTRVGGLLATALERTTPPLRYVDWVDALTNKPDAFFGFYRALSTYTGPCIEVSDGVSTTDVDFRADGWLDVDALLSFAGTSDVYVTKLYDHMGTGLSFVAEGSGSAAIMSNESVILQGRRLAWGDDNTNVLMALTLSGALASMDNTGALLAVGRIADSGNAVQASVNTTDLALFAQGGATKYRNSSGIYVLDTAQEHEPAFITALPGSARGYTTHANYIDSAGMRANGASVAATSGSGTSVGVNGKVSWGGRSTATNRYSKGSHTALGLWLTAPTGTDLDLVDEYCAAIGEVDNR